MKKFISADDNSKVIFITGSGTASMEGSIINILNATDKILIINGGGFGQRFVDICRIHEINYDEIKLSVGEQITREKIEKYDNCGYTALIVNVHETSTGIYYDINLLSEFCKKNNLFFIVDAIYINSAHAEWYKQIKISLQMGKSVLCESPITLPKKQYLELFELSNKNNCILMEGLRTAYSTAYSRLLLLIKTGKIENVMSIDLACTSMQKP